MGRIEFTDDQQLRLYLKRLGMSLLVELSEYDKDVIRIVYEATDGQVKFGESRAISRFDAAHMVELLRELRRDIADAARAVAVGGKEALDAK